MFVCVGTLQRRPVPHSKKSMGEKAKSHPLAVATVLPMAMHVQHFYAKGRVHCTTSVSEQCYSYREQYIKYDKCLQYIVYRTPPLAVGVLPGSEMQQAGKFGPNGVSHALHFTAWNVFNGKCLFLQRR